MQQPLSHGPSAEQAPSPRLTAPFGTGCHWELFGIALTVAGLASGYLTYSNGVATWVPTGAALSYLGVIVTGIAAVAHSIFPSATRERSVDQGSRGL